MARKPFDPDRINKPPSSAPARRERARGDLPSAADYQAPNWPGEDDEKNQASHHTKSSPKPRTGPRKETSEKRAMTVSELSEMVKQTLDRYAPSPVTVIGEVSNFSDRRHWYLTLKDENSKIDAVMWASALKKCRFTPEPGQQVVAQGRLDYYGPQGRLQLYIDRLAPAGLGPLEELYRQLLNELKMRGYFELSRKKELPVFPQKVAVVTSRNAAALQDFIRTTQNRWPSCELFMVDVRVQGGSAAPEIAKAIHWLDQQSESLGLDAMVITRGGGSMEDLWAFNERIVADAIFEAELPVIAAIGHETDTTIAELVADLRCSTPTQAAERLIPDASSEREQLSQMQRRVNNMMSRMIAYEHSELRRFESNPIFTRPAERMLHERQSLQGSQQRMISTLRERLLMHQQRLSQAVNKVSSLEPANRLKHERQTLDADEKRLNHELEMQLKPQSREMDVLQERLIRGMSQQLKIAIDETRALDRQLRAVSPRNVLERGYSFTTTEKGKVIRSASEVKAGNVLMTHFHDGNVPVQALKNASAAKPIRKKKKTSKPDAGNENDAGLFD